MSKTDNLMNKEQVEKKAQDYIKNLTWRPAYMDQHGVMDFTTGYLSGRNEVIEEALKAFQPMFEIVPKQANLIAIAEALRDAYKKIESLKLT